MRKKRPSIAKKYDPYSTGQRLEPLSQTPDRGMLTDERQLTQLPKDIFGKVDFTDIDNVVHCTAYAELDQRTGRYVLHVMTPVGEPDIEVRTHPNN